MSITLKASSMEPFNAGVYNNLFSVGEADRTFQSFPRREYLFQEVGTLICRYNLENSVGVSLLHKHNSVSEDQIMVETYDDATYAKPALVMERVDRNHAVEHVPAVMKVHRDGVSQSLIPLEHSAAAIAQENYRQLLSEGDLFLSSFCEIVRKYGAEDLIGLSLLRADALPCSDEEELIEETDERRVANVVMPEPKKSDPNTRHIITNWQFESVTTYDPVLECVTKCLAKCVSKCVKNSAGQHGEKHEERHEGSGGHIPPR